MSKPSDEKTMESRVEALENTIEKQRNQLRTMAASFSLAKSSAFKSPLARFFEDGARFFNSVEPTNDCRHCAIQYRKDMELANGDEDKEKEATAILLDCMKPCTGEVPPLL